MGDPKREGGMEVERERDIDRDPAQRRLFRAHAKRVAHTTCDPSRGNRQE